MIQKKFSSFKRAKKALDELKKTIPTLSESEKATLELLLDEEAMKDLKESIKEVREGKVVELEKVKA